MRALVTGGTGFVGHWLVDHLKSMGDDVVAHGIEVDVTDPAAIAAAVEAAEPDAIYHLAGQASVGESWKNPARTFEVNALGCVHLISAARRLSRLPRVLLVSSAEVYGAVSPDDLPLTEASPLRPMSPYAASKVAAEFIGYQAAVGYGLPLVIARPFNHIGPGQAPIFVISELAKRIVEAQLSGRRTLALGNPTPRRDFTDVRDVVVAYRLLIQHGEPGSTYNICSGKDVMVGDVVRRLVELAGADLVLETDPALVRPVDVPVLVGDATKLHTATGWSPTWSLDQTLESVLDYWRNE